MSNFLLDDVDKLLKRHSRNIFACSTMCKDNKRWEEARTLSKLITMFVNEPQPDDLMASTLQHGLLKWEREYVDHRHE